MAVGMVRAGQSMRQVAVRFRVEPSTISRLMRKFRLRGNVKQAPGGGRKRKTTPQVDRRIVHHVRSNPFITSTSVNATVRTWGVQVSSRTIRRRVNEAGLYLIIDLFGY